MRRRIVVALAVGIAATSGGVAWAGKSNDVVYHENNYKEYFKQEGNSGKNYLYTITEQPAPRVGYCTVYTFASETGGAVVCNMPSAR